MPAIVHLDDDNLVLDRLVKSFTFHKRVNIFRKIIEPNILRYMTIASIIKPQHTLEHESNLELLNQTSFTPSILD